MYVSCGDGDAQQKTRRASMIGSTLVKIILKRYLLLVLQQKLHALSTKWPETLCMVTNNDEISLLRHKCRRDVRPAAHMPDGLEKDNAGRSISAVSKGTDCKKYIRQILTRAFGIGL